MSTERTSFTCSSIFKPNNVKMLEGLLNNVFVGNSKYRMHLIDMGNGEYRFSCIGSIRALDINGTRLYSDNAFFSRLMQMIPLQQAVIVETVHVDNDCIEGTNELIITNVSSQVFLVTHNTWEAFDSRKAALARVKDLVGIAPKYREPQFAGGY